MYLVLSALSFGMAYFENMKLRMLVYEKQLILERAIELKQAEGYVEEL